VTSKISVSTHELHRHLDGSLRYQTLSDLNKEQHGTPLPSEEEIRFFEGMGLADALSRFKITLAVLQTAAAVNRVAAEMVDDAQTEGLEGLEIRFAPQLHQEDSPDRIVDAVLEGVAGKATLILCGLYGESPEILDNLVSIASSRKGVVGIDLAGGPAPSHEYQLEHYAEVFQKAGRLGLGRTVHASEGRSPAEILRAIRILGADRIGHGTTLLDSPEALDEVLQRNITIEACPTSNVHVGAITSVQSHPIKAWISRGVQVAVCADNTLFSATNIPRELSVLGLDENELAYVNRCSAQARFGARS